MSDLTVSPAANGAGSTVDFPLASLPAGEFLIEVAAKGADGTDSGETKELIAFRMVG
jgi:hypothetical protein